MKLIWAVLWPNSPYVLPEKLQDDAVERSEALKNRSDDRWEVSQGLLSKLEAKSAALLTHVSLMVALTGVFWATSSESTSVVAELPTWVFGMHFVAYLTIALLCIRCQLHVDGSHFKGMELADPQDYFGGHDSSLDVQRRDRAVRENRTRLERLYLGEVVLRERLYRISFLSLYALTIEFVLLIFFLVIPFDFICEHLKNLGGV